MKWKDIWKEEPPRNEEIFFMTGDETIHLGEIFSEDKLRKCTFHSFYYKKDYECDSLTLYEERVIYWFPIPVQPERLNPEDSFDDYLKDPGKYLRRMEDNLINEILCDSPNTANK